ncbi:MAG: sigma-70 family RNA polymerase sigma factor, partial [Verrucomicrobiales bacterium]|nr:sigma-70 family RNA polymerase sigma factor [Verrucomicrobiales bacterium]
METLADRYWYPLYAYLRREGNTADDAADLVQGFLADLLRRPEIGEPDAGRGKFRTFLLVRLRSHARDRWRRERNSEKRGKGYEFVPLDFDVAETCYGRETSEHASPQVLFDHAWARAVLAAARERVRSDMIDRGKGQWFARLEWILDDAGGGARGYSDIARHLQTSESNVKVVALRMRKRFTEAVLAILRAEQGMGVLGEIPDYLIAEDDVKDSAALVRL